MELHDLHTHTTLSECCSDINATAKNYIVNAKKLGIKTLGFSDHMWDSEKVEGASSWYLPQNFSHVKGIREDIDKLNDSTEIGDINILFGVETEYANGVIGIDKSTAKEFDYILCPHSHFHMTGYTIPKEITEVKDIAKMLVKTFKEVAKIELVTAIVHPFDPCIKNSGDNLTELYSNITDEEFFECFRIARECNTAVEINLASCVPHKKEVFNKTYLRMLKIAKEQGCTFVCGSDTHSIKNQSNILKVFDILEDLGSNDMHWLEISKKN